MKTIPTMLTSIMFLSIAFMAQACTHNDQLEKSISKSLDPGAEIVVIDSTNIDNDKFRYLALGDSYTVGTSVSTSENFPNQLTNRLKTHFNEVFLEMIATAGWRTDNLLDAIEERKLENGYDLVTLLIGVNNQYQGLPFTNYENDFRELLNKAITLANGQAKHVVVVSIPDYAYTPFAESFDRQKISEEIDFYNEFAKTVAEENEVQFINITDITRLGLFEPELVANDNLHPSGIAYKRFVDLIFPLIISQLKD